MKKLMVGMLGAVLAFTLCSCALVCDLAKIPVEIGKGFWEIGKVCFETPRQREERLAKEEAERLAKEEAERKAAQERIEAEEAQREAERKAEEERKAKEWAELKKSEEYVFANRAICDSEVPLYNNIKSGTRLSVIADNPNAELKGSVVCTENYYSCDYVKTFENRNVTFRFGMATKNSPTEGVVEVVLDFPPDFDIKVIKEKFASRYPGKSWETSTTPASKWIRGSEGYYGRQAPGTLYTIGDENTCITVLETIYEIAASPRATEVTKVTQVSCKITDIKQKKAYQALYQKEKAAEAEAKRQRDEALLDF